MVWAFITLVGDEVNRIEIELGDGDTKGKVGDSKQSMAREWHQQPLRKDEDSREKNGDAQTLLDANQPGLCGAQAE